MNVVLLLLVGVGVVLWVAASRGPTTSLTSLFRATKNLATIGIRQVYGPVIALTGDGDDQVADLLIENWQLDTLFSDTNTRKVIPIFWSVTHAKNGQRTIRWETEVGRDESPPEVNTAFDGTLIYLSVNDRLQALRQADGVLLWEARLSDLVESRCKRCIRVVNGRVIVLSVDQVLQALDVTTGKVIWQVHLNDDSAPASWLGSVGFALAGQQVLVIDGTEDASHVKELRIYNALDGTVVRRLSPTCSDAGASRSDRRLDRQSPVLVDERNNRVYTVIERPGFSPCVQSWDISSGELVWEARLPEDSKLAQDVPSGLHIDPSAPFFVLGERSLYVPVATAVSDSAIVRIDLTSGQPDPLLEVEDFATMPLGEQGNTLIVRAKRTRGSESTELWSLDRATGERTWQHELQASELLNLESGFGQEWAYRLTPRGLTVIQLLADPVRLQVQMIDLPTGQVVYETSSSLDNDFWTGVTWTSNTAYLTIRNLYGVDLETGKAAWEWP
jgi:outer membrane protein assembly factor BamB